MNGIEDNNTDAAYVNKNESIVNNTGISHADSKKVLPSVMLPSVTKLYLQNGAALVFRCDLSQL
ncbi:MAG: hypothetical protein M3275_13545 [Thermoproteota archaeon]|nr:hypothetical protein [Thermoproteota archaeon]